MSNFRFWNSLSLSLFWCLCVSSWLPCHIYAARSARCPRNRRIQQPDHALRPAPHVDAIRAAKAQGPCRERFTLLSLARSLDSLLAGAGSDMLVAATVISKIIYRFIVTRARALLSSESVAFAETALPTRDSVLSTAGQSREGAANAAAYLLQSLKWSLKTLSAPLALAPTRSPQARGAVPSFAEGSMDGCIERIYGQMKTLSLLQFHYLPSHPFPPVSLTQKENLPPSKLHYRYSRV